ncbi:MAG: type II toxin-antitoxin system RelE/ParE family toxin [Bacteroidota bacterium]
MKEVFWTRPAENDLKAIFDFLTEARGWKDEKVFAIIDKIIEKVGTLETNFPGVGQVEPLLESKDRKYRYLIEDTYKIIYSYEENTIYIHMVFDTRQNPDKVRGRFEGSD